MCWLLLVVMFETTGTDVAADCNDCDSEASGCAAGGEGQDGKPQPRHKKKAKQVRCLHPCFAV